MAQAVSRQPLASRTRARVSPCGIYGRQWDRFLSEFSGFPCQYNFTMAVYTHVSSGRRTKGPLVRAV
jgi:hypothetical protein